MFEPIMGMEPSTIYSMLPINDRKVGVILDASVTNPDMARARPAGAARMRVKRVIRERMWWSL